MLSQISNPQNPNCHSTPKMSSRISTFLYAICLLFLPAVSFTTGSSGNEEDEETNSSISGTTVSELPLSAVHEILLRLPHKSFIRCKSVCKSWLNLISDPYFTKAYFANPPFTALVLLQRLLFKNIVSFRFVEIDDSNGDVTFAPFHPRALDFPVNGNFLRIRGSCNGLLCITRTLFDIVVVYVINPLLGEFLKLPPVGFQKITADYILFGFGCSRYTNRYKLLKVQNYDAGMVHCEILTVGVDENWRSLEDASFTTNLVDDGFTMNGVVHFLGDDYVYGYIIAFDVEEERGRHINLPPGLLDHRSTNFHLAVWDDKLCFSENYIDHVDIWTMKEYGVVESWSKEIILTSWVPFELRPYFLDAITTLRNKDLLMSRHCQTDTQLPYLTSYNPTVKMCTTHEVPGATTEDVASYWSAYVPNVIPLMDNLLGGGSQ